METGRSGIIVGYLGTQNCAVERQTNKVQTCRQMYDVQLSDSKTEGQEVDTQTDRKERQAGRQQTDRK